MLWLPVFVILTCTQMLMRVTAHKSCANTRGESALKVHSGRKDPLLLQMGFEPASIATATGFSGQCSTNWATSYPLITDILTTCYYQRHLTQKADRHYNPSSVPPPVWMDTLTPEAPTRTASARKVQCTESSAAEMEPQEPANSVKTMLSSLISAAAWVQLAALHQDLGKTAWSERLM